MSVPRSATGATHCSDVPRGYVALQRHFSALAKFAHVESRFCGRKRRGKAAFDTPINPCVRSTCSRSVAVGLEGCPRISYGENLTSQNAPGSTIGDLGEVLLPPK